MGATGTVTSTLMYGVLCSLLQRHRVAGMLMLEKSLACGVPQSTPFSPTGACRIEELADAIDLESSHNALGDNGVPVCRVW
jgi:hypothetical protein